VTDYLQSVKMQLAYYKTLAEKTITQLSDEQLFLQYNRECNSVATIVKHLAGNMKSRWTDFLTTDGEKAWRNRDAEFDNDLSDRAELLDKWNKGWASCFDALNALTEADLTKKVVIRNQTHTVLDAINRQLAHYPYHIGQIIFIGKMLIGDKWTSLSIPRGKSIEHNAENLPQPNEK
jgi:uncharacterized damage-inducible protein DinB